jgi:Tol biopolymer transport system component
VKGTIVFSRAGDIWAATGRELNRLTDADATKSDSSPTWSPDGKRVYFIRTTRRPTADSREGGLYTLYVTDVWRMQADGSKREEVYNSLIKDAAGTWFSHVLQPDVSPDGDTLAVVSDGPDGSGPVELHLINIRNGRMEKVAAPADGDLGHSDPAFSPDGQKIAFTYNNAQGTDGVPRIGIHTCQTRKNCSAGPTKLLRPGYAHPSWSPDSEWLAVEATRGIGRDIAIIDPRRGDVRVLLTDDGNSFAPVVSPDGSQIAYLHRDGVAIDVRVMTLDIASDGKITLVEDRPVTDDGSIDGDSPPEWFIPTDQLPADIDDATALDASLASAAPVEPGASTAADGAPPPPG